MTFQIADSSFKIPEALILKYDLASEKFICLLEALQNADIDISASLIDDNVKIKKQFNIIEDFIQKCCTLKNTGRLQRNS
jgi:hypothetical protein